MFGLQLIGYFAAQATKQFAPTTIRLLALSFCLTLFFLTAGNRSNDFIVCLYVLQVLRFCRFETFKGGCNRVCSHLVHGGITPSQSMWSHFASSHTTPQSMPVVPFPIQHTLKSN
ncbi:hypothetical protein DVQ31_16320 [Yersinia enterocolitica]|nr:hypothetical protein [Yersinia enterocolitica]